MPSQTADKPLAGSSLLIWRVGGVGDHIWITAALPVIRRTGMTIDVCSDVRGEAVYANNPNVRRFLPWELERAPGGLPMDDPEHPNRLRPDRVQAWWADKMKAGGYTHGAALTWTIEGKYLWRKSDNPAEYWMDQAERQTHVNYTDEVVRRLSLAHIGGLLPELYPTKAERRWLDELQRGHRQRGEQFLLWHVTGSSFNKVLPMVMQYISGLLQHFPKLVVYLLGDARLAEFERPELLRAEEWPRCRSVRDKWSLRQQLLATSVADCVCGPESAITNAAAAFDTPKVVFLSHSAHENLSLYWWNAYPITPDPVKAPCAPCWRIVEGPAEECLVTEADLGFPITSGTGERGKGVGAKCCVYLDHDHVFQTVGTILYGRKDRTCPVCKRQKNRLLEPGVYGCICGIRFGLPSGDPRPPLQPPALRCPICGDFTSLRLQTVGQIGWAACPCGVVFQEAKHLDDAVYDQTYTAKYDAPGIRAKIRAVGERWLPTIEQLLGAPGRLLEIGYCLPEVLTCARERGWTIAGVEINPTAPNGDFPRFVGNFETLPLDDLGPGTWDCVFSNHVFEHFRDPLAALDKMVALLKPNGVLFLATPDAAGRIEGHLHRKEHHVMWTAPALRAQCEARGLTVHEIEHHEGEECGFISWFDFHLVAQRAPILADARAGTAVGVASTEEHGNGE